MKQWNARGTLESILKNCKKICERSTIKYEIKNYGVALDLQKKSFVEPPETLLKELDCLVQIYRIAI